MGAVTDAVVERAARAANLEAGRQRGLATVDDWDYLTEQERGGWRLVARAVINAIEQRPPQPRCSKCRDTGRLRVGGGPGLIGRVRYCTCPAGPRQLGMDIIATAKADTEAQR